MTFLIDSFIKSNYSLKHSFLFFATGFVRQLDIFQGILNASNNRLSFRIKKEATFNESIDDDNDIVDGNLDVSNIGEK